MDTPHRPAAYLPAAGAAASRAVALAAGRQGWPAPAVYSGAEGLGHLRAAVTAGRYDAVLMPAEGAIQDPAPLMALLAACTSAGVPVSLIPLAVVPPEPAAPPATAEILAQAGVEALAEVFTGWRVWADERGWHARRRSGEGYAQSRRAGVPVYYVGAPDAVGLAAQLCWQQAADDHTPDGCSTTSPPGCGPVYRAS